MSRPATRVAQDSLPRSIPQTQEQTVEAIAEIGRLQRERSRLEAAMNDELAAIRQQWESRAHPHLERIRELTLGVQAWCGANRDRLTRGGKTKTVKLASGEVQWRTTPPKVTIRDAENVIEALRASGLLHMIRVKEEVNKEAISLDPAAVEGIKGISVTQKELFVVAPFETELEEIA